MPRRHVPPPAPQLLPEPIILHDVPTIAGAGIGKTIGVPTINLDLRFVPRNMKHGVYACTVSLDGKILLGAMSYGLRPSIQTGVAMEIHLIDENLPTLPPKVSVNIIAYVRDIFKFPSMKALVAQIQRDILTIRGILNT